MRAGLDLAGLVLSPAGEREPENLELMRLIDEAFLEMPWYGAVRWRGICGGWAGALAASGCGV